MTNKACVSQGFLIWIDNFYKKKEIKNLRSEAEALDRMIK